MANGTIEKGAMHKLSYGLFALFTNDGKKDNACIINTATQISDNPTTICICVNRANYSNEIIKQSGVFTISVLSESAPFDIFKRFGFASGRDTDKLDGFDKVATSANGLKYLTEYSNAFIRQNLELLIILLQINIDTYLYLFDHRSNLQRLYLILLNMLHELLSEQVLVPQQEH